MKQRLDIGILVSTKRSRRSTLSKYLEHRPGLQSRVFAFTYGGIDWRRRRIRGLCLAGSQFRRRTVPFPSCVLNRRYSPRTRTTRRLTEALGEGRVFNMKTRFDKWEIHRILHTSPFKAHLPDTLLLEHTDPVSILDSGHSWFLKPRLGLGGKGVYMIRRDAAGAYCIHKGAVSPKYKYADASAFASHVLKLAGSASYIVQRQIPLLQVGDRLAELRTIVQKNGSGAWTMTGGFFKIAYPRVNVTNYCHRLAGITETLGKSLLPTETQNQLVNQLQTLGTGLAEYAERHLGALGEITVDFGIDLQGFPRIIEVNGFPSTSTVRGTGNRKLLRAFISYPLDYAVYLSSLDGGGQP